LVLGPLKKQREEVLLAREKALLPATSQLLSLKAKEEAIRREIKEKQDELYAISLEANIINRQMAGWTLTANEEKIVKTQRIVCPCPGEDCRGFIFGNYECSLCPISICKDCRVPVAKDDTAHECKEDDLATVKLIQKECKACPGCGAPSRKTEGCSQVWCLVCHKAWNWNTGEIETGAIHATDYYNYMRNQGIQLPAGPVLQNCNHNIMNRFIPTINLLQKTHPTIVTEEKKNFLWLRYRLCQEFSPYRNEGLTQQNHMDLRCKFLRGELDERSNHKPNWYCT
jgi:hypothetical protein